MNRTILIDNGFDLAHSMRTGYKDFIEAYWEDITKEIKKAKRNKLFENAEIKIERCPTKYEYPIGETYEDLTKALKYCGTRIGYKNRFLKIITEKNGLNKWVDIEDEYYRLLKESIDYPNKSDGYTIDQLNEDFNTIKVKLTEYLKKVESDFKSNTVLSFSTIKDTIGAKIYQPFNYSNFSGTALNELAEIELELLRKDNKRLKEDLDEIEKLRSRRVSLIESIKSESNPLDQVKYTLQSQMASDYFDLNPDVILFLNFNYTNMHNIYDYPQMSDSFWKINLPRTRSISIHGSIDEPEKNPIIFGFGDEIDEDYKTIENLNDNKYLENIKSINYLESGNYKSLLKYIEGGYFEIFIFGHSCGISDRTLLNTMFEHDNCASVKVFYHKREDESDNYSDVIRNISRNFNDKAKMRDRVVNKGSCEPLC